MNDALKQKRILIVGTQPYNPMVQSRAFDSYFHFHDSDKIAQVFSDSRKPCQGHCGTMYQITDKALLKARFNKTDPGVIWRREDLPASWDQTQASSGFRPKRKTALTRLLRKFVWEKKLYLTKRFLDWLDTFSPEVIFLSFSRDFFIFDIAFFVADRFGIPIIASTADDYIFDQGFSISPFSWLYRKKYRAYIECLANHRSCFMFEERKIQERYEKEFSIPSFVQHIGTDNAVASSASISKRIQSIGYFGNLEYGRLQSILKIAHALQKLDPSVVIELYSKDIDLLTKTLRKKHPNIKPHSQVPYAELLTIMERVDATLLVEGFKKKDVLAVKYSLSTKVADMMALGKPILAYGHAETGAMSFLLDRKCALCLSAKQPLEGQLKGFLASPSLAAPFVERAISIVRNEFLVDSVARAFEKNVSLFLDGKPFENDGIKH